MPVPAPIMIIGRCGFSGGRNGKVGSRPVTKTVPPSGVSRRWCEQTPRNSPVPDRAGSSSTPTVTAASACAAGEEEIE